jgi:hypothetical protein
LISLDEAEPSGVEVMIMLLSGDGQAASAWVEATPTPGAPPTADPSASGLPADIPLYPGDTDLINLGSGMIQFQTGDVPEKVDEWYQNQMASLEWTSLSHTVQDPTIIQVWMKDTRTATITIIQQGEKALGMIAVASM